ncbi:MAG TPA: hypothetical protein VMD99_03870 [Terriglobales bacterium]|nr:hypothetical protein [Terriglobales bacterium]
MTAGPKQASHRDHDPRLEAAQKRLRESAGQADAIEAIREIVTNLLGCEEIGLFIVAPGTDKPNGQLLWSFGIDPQRHGTLDALEEPALHRVLQGELHVAQTARKEHAKGNPPLRAFIPIRLHGRTVAVLVMLKLLPQKLGLDQADINLVKLISNEAGKPLFEGSAKANA